MFYRHGGTPWLKGLPVPPFYQRAHLDILLVLLLAVSTFFALPIAFCLRSRRRSASENSSACS